MGAKMAVEFYLRNDEEAGIKRLRDKTGAFIDDATVTLTIKDSAGAEVGGIAWPLALDYVALSEGHYLGIIDKAIALTKGVKYLAEITVVASGGRDAGWDIEFTAERRS